MVSRRGRHPRVVAGSEIGELANRSRNASFPADRSVAVLGENDLGQALILGMVVVVPVAVQEHDEIGVLLN